MREFKCIVEGCDTILKTELPVSDGFQYICSGRVAYGDDKLKHTRAQQCLAVGRQYNPVKDETDKDVHFQSFAFDKDLDRNKHNTDDMNVEPNYKEPE